MGRLYPFHLPHPPGCAKLNSWSKTEEPISSEPGKTPCCCRPSRLFAAGDRPQARDLLTRLLKADQKNVQYWVWLSAAVDTQKERLYCLQTAIQLDPQNAAAKRGLILFGALPPDDSVPPFPVNRPRLWEEKLAIATKPPETPRGWANPLTRVFMVLGIAIIVLGLSVGGFMLLPEAGQTNHHPPLPPAARRQPLRTLQPTRRLPACALPRRPSSVQRRCGCSWIRPIRPLRSTWLPSIPSPAAAPMKRVCVSWVQKIIKTLWSCSSKRYSLEPAAPDILYYIAEIVPRPG